MRFFSLLTLVSLVSCCATSTTTAFPSRQDTSNPMVGHSMRRLMAKTYNGHSAAASRPRGKGEAQQNANNWNARIAANVERMGLHRMPLNVIADQARTYFLAQKQDLTQKMNHISNFKPSTMAPPQTLVGISGSRLNRPIPPPLKTPQ